MIAYQIIRCSCDGGRIGKVWDQEFYYDKDRAERFLAATVEKHNQRERLHAQQRHVSDLNWRLLTEAVVEGIQGYCSWCYGVMVYLAEIHIKV